MIRVRYFYSACIGTETPETSILCDPWFTEGIYDGSWYHYPPFDGALETLPAADYIYISHIHPDHYDPKFLRDYLNRHPESKVIIRNFNANFLSKKMYADQICHKIVTELAIGKTRLRLVPNELTPFDVDSALVIVREGHSVVNMSDNSANDDQLGQILEYIGCRPTIALLGYTGAGPYPQTYYTDPSILEQKAKEKKRRMF